MNLKIRNKILIGFIGVCIVFLVNAFISFINYNSLKTSINQIGRKNAPLTYAVKEIKIGITVAHLWLEEVLNGAEPPESIDKVRTHINDAKFYANAIVSGGKSSLVTFYPTEDADIRKQTEKVSSLLTVFSETAELRYNTLFVEKKADNMQVLDDQFDKAFDELMVESDALENIISDLVSKGVESAENTADKGLYTSIISLLIALLLAVISSIILSNILVKPIKALAGVLKEATKSKNLTVRVVNGSTDEIGQSSANFNDFIESIGSILKVVKETVTYLNNDSEILFGVSNKLTAASEETIQKTKAVSHTVEEISRSIDGNTAALTSTSEYMNAITSLTDDISGRVRNLAAASEQAESRVNNISSEVSQISENISSISEYSKDVSNSMNSVAISIREINVSLAEISNNSERSKNITSNAEEQAINTNAIIEKLNLSSKQIEKIINVISDIADQTNMLALNAAIEAAGAGEAGKGFAVVANEVKELAKQTSEATFEITDKINEMRSNMTDAVKAVEIINIIINEMISITNTIAASVTEQSAVTDGISASIQKAAEKTNNISEKILGVSANTKNVTEDIKEALSKVKNISHSASELSVSSSEVAKNTDIAFSKVHDVSIMSQEISQGAKAITKNIQEVSVALSVVESEAVNTNRSSKEITEVAAKLNNLVYQFKV